MTPTADEPLYVILLTPSQKMALADVIMAALHQGRITTFYDATRRVETTAEDLLMLVVDAIQEEV